MILVLVLLRAPLASADLAGYVHPLAGTQPGPRTFGGGHDFPGAALPFGMVQFSPDTSPAGGSDGYDYRDKHTRGFSLTHLSGAGCSLYADFPFLPTVGPLTSSPAIAGSPDLASRFRPGFSHAHESAAPGRYSVQLLSQRHRIAADLTATTRSGLARFGFPRSAHAGVLIDAGGSANPADHADVEIDPATAEITGSSSSGFFCAQRPRYRVYFAAQFNRPFASYATWHRQSLAPESTAAADDVPARALGPGGAQAGAYVGFDARHRRGVQMKVGISFVSTDAARRNLAAEQRGFAFQKVAAAARRSWDRELGSIRVSGGPRSRLASFYTALYRALLAPRTFNDADGGYPGMDGQVHSTGGGTQYADLSGWDVYRTQIPLLAMLKPGRASGIVRSVLDDAAESGCLPRWPYANGQSMTMVGDPSDPIIASAAAYGAAGFDRGAALAAMVKGATQTCRSPNSSYVERQGLDAYQSLGYLPYDIDAQKRNSNSRFGDPDAVWGSASTTLEYQTADFAIAQFAARFAADRATYSSFMQRAGNWRKLFNPASRTIEPRMASGSFLPGYDDLRGGGFVEGDAAQYTWMVPFDPGGLARAIGSRRAAASRLARFLGTLNSPDGGNSAHALLGNEPNLNSPWLFDWFGKPYLTQATMRRALLSLYSARPGGWPGNDDLGTLSSWYVLGALGLYPEAPGSGVLALSTPLFAHAKLRIGGRAVRIDAPAAARNRYIRSLRVNGHRVARPWTTYCALAHGAHLRYSLAPRPRRHWGASTAASPPSYGPNRAAPKSSCSP